MQLRQFRVGESGFQVFVPATGRQKVARAVSPAFQVREAAVRLALYLDGEGVGAYVARVGQGRVLGLDS